MVTQLFGVLGVIFMMLLVVVILLFATDISGIRTSLLDSVASTALLSNDSGPATNLEGEEATNLYTQSEKPQGFELTEAQIEALEALGVDRATVPHSIDVIQETCFSNRLGSSRVVEFKAGSIPTIAEFVMIESCL